MRPVSVEYLFDGDKTVFYFESDERVDFRELVRKLSSHFRTRVDMRQIGVRDEARLVGGIGHCGQELCCKRLGGEFCPVSIRMAKDQDLSLNPQKISGICGRLMCCLRYEYDVYKDFKSRAPKVGGSVETPDGKGKVVQHDVPREIVTVQVAEEKKVKVPLEDFSRSSEAVVRPDTIDKEAWNRARDREEMSIFGEVSFMTSQFTQSDKLGEAKAVHREPSAKDEKREKQSSRSSRRSLRSSAAKASRVAEPAAPQRKRRRSTKLGEDGTAVTETAVQMQDRKRESAAEPAQQERKVKQQSSRSRRRRGGSKLAAERAESAANTAQPSDKASSAAGSAEKAALRPGHRSSALRQHEGAAASEQRHASAKPANGKQNGVRSGNGKPAGARSAAKSAGAKQAGAKPAQGPRKEAAPKASGAGAEGAADAPRKRRRYRRRGGSGNGSSNGGDKGAAEKSE